MDKKCAVCRKTFHVKPSAFSRRHHCSKICKFVFDKRRMMEEKNPSYLGKNVGYQGLHFWLKRTFGIPDHCDLCGLNKAPKKLSGKRKKNYFEWSNKTGIYERSARHWWQLCVRCHKRFDLIFHY